MSIQTDSGRFPIERISPLEAIISRILGAFISPTKTFTENIDGNDVEYYRANEIKLFGKTYYLSQDVLEISNPEPKFKTTIERLHVKGGFEYVLREQSQDYTITYRRDFVVVETNGGVLVYNSDGITDEKGKKIKDINLWKKFYENREVMLDYAKSQFDSYIERIKPMNK